MDDLISRQAVLDELEKWEWQELYLPIHFKQILDDVPSVENKGEWTIRQYQVPIENKQIPTIISTPDQKHTACKIVYSYTHSACKSEEYLTKYNYCPNCGVRMIEYQESED